MKKRACLVALTVFVLLTSIPQFAVAAVEDRFGDSHEAYEERLYGNLNMDWKLDALDYMLVKRAVLGTYSISEHDKVVQELEQTTSCLGPDVTRGENTDWVDQADESGSYPHPTLRSRVRLMI